jgi:Flp pilus assembly protein TadB
MGKKHRGACGPEFGCHAIVVTVVLVVVVVVVVVGIGVEVVVVAVVAAVVLGENMFFRNFW